MSRRSKYRYGVAAATAASTNGSSSCERTMATSWLAKKPRRSAGSDANAVIARWRSTGESPMTQSSSMPCSSSMLPVRRPSARAAWIHTSGSGCSSSGCSSESVLPTSSWLVLGVTAHTLTSRQRAASTRPRRAPCAGLPISASKAAGERHTHAPNSGSSSAREPASQIRISRRERTSVFMGCSRSLPSPVSGTQASASSSGPLTTRSRAAPATAERSATSPAAASSNPAMLVSPRHALDEHQVSSTSPPWFANNVNSATSASGCMLSAGSSTDTRSAAARSSFGRSSSSVGSSRQCRRSMGSRSG
jgi:hypothetical protein